MDTAELLVSELVTNAVRATDAVSSLPLVSAMFPVPLRTVAVRLRLPAASHSLFIEVWDVSASLPAPRHRGEVDGADLEEGGRGLELVEGLAKRWGYYTARDRGKIVWCELSTAPVSVPDPPSAPAGAPPVSPGPDDLVSALGSSPPRLAVPAHALPTRARRHPRVGWAEGPDRDTLLRVLHGLRALD